MFVHLSPNALDVNKQKTAVFNLDGSYFLISGNRVFGTLFFIYALFSLAFAFIFYGYLSMSNSTNRSRTLLKGSMIKEDSPEDGLYSLEKLRTSPELWPEKIPGISNFIAMSDTPIRTPVPQWSKDLSQEDINAMIQLSNMPFSNLIMEIKKMYDEAYQLGVSEAKEMTRGKYLGIFNNAKKKTI